MNCTMTRSSAVERVFDVDIVCCYYKRDKVGNFDVDFFKTIIVSVKSRNNVFNCNGNHTEIVT